MIYQKIKNLDIFFKESLGDKIILNDVKYYSMEDRDLITKSLVTVYDDDTISMIPACDCGHLEGGYLKGKHCNKCSTTVRDIHDKTDPLLWMHAVDEMPHFLSPHFWLMMKNVMGKKIDAMRWLGDTSYNPPDIPEYLIGLKNTLPEFERSYPFLVNHIEDILIYMKNHSYFKTPTKADTINGLITLYADNKDKLYSYYLPIVNKKLFIMENTSKGKYTDLGIADVIDTTLQFVKTVNDSKLTPNKRSNCMSRTISDLSAIYNYYNKNYLSSKPGIFRKHQYGARAHFTFRAVISSISGSHRHNEIVPPWSIMVTAFRPHILNKLSKRGYSYKDASKMLFYSVNNYVEEIGSILDELITETPGGKGIPVIMQRNQR